MEQDQIFQYMQDTVDIVHDSQHPTSKVAALITGQDKSGQNFAIARTNHWPEKIEQAFGREARIGNASGTIHAETAALLAAPVTAGSSCFITDPPCPNCVKNMAEAGMKALYIDHKGFEKDFAQRRGLDFEDMSIEICKKAGISVFKTFRKERKIEPLLEIAESYTPIIEKPAILETLEEMPDHALFQNCIVKTKEQFQGRHHALAFAKGDLGSNYIIMAEIHPVAGFTTGSIERHETKYSFYLQPLNRILMTASRYGFKVDPHFVYSSRVPTARELVDSIGAGIETLYIGDQKESRDEHGIEALKVIRDAGVLEIKPS